MSVYLFIYLFFICVPLCCYSRIRNLVDTFSGFVITVSSCRYLGDEVGTVSVLQYDENSNELVKLPYCIPAYITLGNLTFSL